MPIEEGELSEHPHSVERRRGRGGRVQTRLPEALPVLPLRDSVPFPETLTPLAVGQERSVKLVNDVLGGNRMLVMVACRTARSRSPARTTSTAWAWPAWSRG